MSSITLNNQDKLILKKIGVDALILFGSHAQNLAGPMSDFDFGVLLNNQKNYFLSDHKKLIYDALYDMLSQKINKLINIDIVFLEQAPMELKNHVAGCGVILYQRHPSLFAQFREKVINQYTDFEPLRNIFHKAILARIP